MFKRCLHIILLIGLPLFCLSQDDEPFDSTENKSLDSLQQKLHLAPDDSSLIIAFERIGFFYARLNIDSSLKYFNSGLRLARQKSYAWAEARLLAGLSGVMEYQGKFAEAFELLFQSLKIAEESKSGYDIARANRRISGVYFELENYPKAIAYIIKALQIDEANQLEDKVAIDHYALADAYEKINKLDSAAFHINIALKQKDYLKGLMQYVYDIDGHIKQKKGNDAQAFVSYNKGFKKAQESSDLIASSRICADISNLYVKLNVRDSAIFYALKGYNDGKKVSFKKGIMFNCNLLAELYDSTQPSLALQYYKIAAAAKDGLFGVNNLQTIQKLISGEETRQKQLEEAEAAYKEKIRLYGLLSGLAVLLIIAFILFRNNRHKQKANALLRQQKQKVESTLSELKSTQAQLIQSEKMASLGELTAGIAHEIQNPLNFVNNFSEVNKELLLEMKDEIDKGNMNEAKLLADDLIDNQEKINQHGKRADAIVKGMLQHSRSSSGVKEPTDINALCDEYIRLCYHGLRAKDKSFNATMETHFDENLQKIAVIPQDIGRVLLNLYNNAFYAVSEKKKSQGDNYEPTVSVSTKQIGNKTDSYRVDISVKDNGMGIAQKVLDKIYQPFFTTKPTGQGTGLGLSLSYDIIKAHGGEIKVETKEGEGAEFIIQLPLNQVKL
jgi:signal transduction histidine kinase